MIPAKDLAPPSHIDDEAPFLEMAWAVPEYSKRKVNVAGREIIYPPRTDLINWVQALGVVNNWRASHSFPLNTFQIGLRSKGRNVDHHCLVAQRIKRLSSIEEKLLRFPTMTLSQMQDIMAVKKCGVCDSENVHPQARAAESKSGPFIAYKWFCDDCLSNVSLGVSKELGGLFLKWDTKWFKSEKKTESIPI